MLESLDNNLTNDLINHVTHTNRSKLGHIERTRDCRHQGGSEEVAELGAAARGEFCEYGGCEELTEWTGKGAGTTTLAPEAGSVFVRGISCAAGEWA
ncbi:hypothetical protein LWI29_016701 [Acer saccharum]|uniref:Uncharacterized protein n=1 Tax=Acer saccharum TaxID=4024 RepID=A0AA39RS36_ACESA|nr:hypothetical protein LWI29_016701 [Acer saccharum]